MKKPQYYIAKQKIDLKASRHIQPNFGIRPARVRINSVPQKANCKLSYKIDILLMKYLL